MQVEMTYADQLTISVNNRQADALEDTACNWTRTMLTTSRLYWSRLAKFRLEYQLGAADFEPRLHRCKAL